MATSDKRRFADLHKRLERLEETMKAKILFPTDFSRLSEAALPMATSIARDRHAELIILHVQEPPAAYAAGELYFGPMEPDTETIRQALEQVRVSDPGVPCIHHLVMGDPAKEIIRLADDEDVDMIVMSTRGRTGLAHVLMGSVAEKVVRRANCPVLVVKSPAKKEHALGTTKSGAEHANHS
jgi:nucleotide-binding universal stress UspA family protein